VRSLKACLFSGCESCPATVVPASSSRSNDGGNESVKASDAILEKQGAIAFEGAFAHLVAARFDVESELNIGVKEVCLHGCGVGPVLRLLQQEQAGDGVEFLGVPTDVGAEMFAEFLGRHNFKQGRVKNALAAFVNAIKSAGRDHAFEGIEKTSLSRIDGMKHCP
jgi:hypothetical protein